MKWHTIAFTDIELRALWHCADIGYHSQSPALDKDPFLEAAAERGIDKVYRTMRGMPKRPTPEPEGGRKPGPALDLTRKHRATNCECPKCAKGDAA